LDGFENEERVKRERKEKEKEKEERKEGRKGKRKIQIPKEMQISKKTKQMLFFLILFFIFLNFFEMKLRPNLETPNPQ
jgi:hypothetical protein